MKTNIGIFSRVLLAICALALVMVLFVPLWKIDLVAPQYPEGLSLLIYPHKLGGDVEIINGLNHYIGMKTLHTKDFIEFTLLPWIIIFFALLFLTAAIIGKKKILYFAFGLFLLFGIIAMGDFYRWEYNYGHDLNPDAAIKVPGMSYQPPLIGHKQLLNFSAWSMPHTGGILFIGAGLLALLATAMAWKKSRKSKKMFTPNNTLLAAMLLFVITGCSQSPQPIKLGTDNCSHCRMTITDAKYGAEIVTRKGKVYKFDDTPCVLAYLKNSIGEKEVSGVYFVSFDGKHDLIKAETAFYFKSEELRTPMGGKTAACSSKDSAQQLSARHQGTLLTWDELRKQ